MDTLSTNRTENWQSDVAHVVHPYSNLDTHQTSGPTVMVRGEGCYVFDEQGKRYLEGMSGLWCAALGFSNQRLADAASAQLAALPYYHLFNHHSHPAGIALSKKLAEMAPAGLEHVLFANSGSEANDAAVKLVWYYNNTLGRPEKKKIISRKLAYHGITIASGSMTGLPPVHADFDLPIDRVLHTDCPSYYHYGEPGESEAQYTDRIVNNLEQMIQSEGADTIAAFIAEPVMGAGGVIVPPAGYFAKVQALLRKHDILFIVDEVICGFGRTGQMFGSDTYDLQPDMMTVAKGLSAAYLPISALLLSKQINDVLLEASRKQKTFAHGGTYAAHPVCAAVALEALNIYQERNIVDHVKGLEPYFLGRLKELESHPLIGQARGVGFLAAVELVSDKQTKTAFDASLGLGAWVQKRAAHYGVIVRAIRDSIAMCPPLISEKQQIDELVDGLRAALDDAIEYVGKQA